MLTVASDQLDASGKADGQLYLHQQVVICVVFDEADMADSRRWVGFLSLNACRKLLHACFKGRPVPLLFSALQESVATLAL